MINDSLFKLIVVFNLIHDGLYSKPGLLEVNQADSLVSSKKIEASKDSLRALQRPIDINN